MVIVKAWRGVDVVSIAYCGWELGMHMAVALPQTTQQHQQQTRFNRG
jgi:hypothetical protein